MPETITEAASRLCTACGLCCNGTLFEIVRLQPQDSIRELEALGMAISRRKSEPYFRQPCRFLNGCTCTIYSQRPERCRDFECRQLRLLASGEISEAEIQENIQAAQDLVRRVGQALARLGDTAEHEALGERLRRALAEHADHELHEAAGLLRSRLDRDFHSRQL